MKNIIFVLFVLCCSLPSAAQHDSTKTTGKVSHMYRKSGCSTVIILKTSPEQVLIPKEKLPKGLDKDGLVICFNYRKLRMANPKGCMKGTVAEITNASKKK
jgi:hypothetical protein